MSYHFILLLQAPKILGADLATFKYESAAIVNRQIKKFT